MRKPINISIKDNLRRLDYYNILENDKKAVNAWSILSPWQSSSKRKKEVLKRKIMSNTQKFALRAWIMCWMAWVIFIWWAKVYAYTDQVTMYWGSKLVTVYDDQVKEMINRGYSKTKILDLLTLRTMECNRYDGLCYWIKNRDLGFFQINIIHIEQYRKSLKLMKQRKSWELFLYQLDYASKLYDSYQDRFCWQHIYKQIGKTYTNKRHFTCIAYSYNGSPRYKYAYAKIGWLKRLKVKEYLKNNYNF